MIPLFTMAGFIMLKIDPLFVSENIKIISDKYRDSILVNPVFTLSVMDGSYLCPGLNILLLGLLPVILQAFLFSFNKGLLKILPAVPCMIFITILWSNYALVNLYDKEMVPQGVYGGFHLFFKGEIEKVMIDKPEKLFKSNPDFRKYGNSDLEKFLIKKNLIDKES